MSLETKFDITFTAILADKEKQIQQSYRPFIGIHKWFARRPGTVFRSLLLSEYNGEEDIAVSFWRAHQMKGIIADPFMGGGTPLLEANRLGFSIVGADINPMAFWIVRQALDPLDLPEFRKTADAIVNRVEHEVGRYYNTTCILCGGEARVKYFMWVKTQECPHCGTINDLFPGYLLAEDCRHPAHVIACRHCGALNEFDRQPTSSDPRLCQKCGHGVSIEGTAVRNKVVCKSCRSAFRYPPQTPKGAPSHRMWAIEYHCASCKAHHKGRFFKQPDKDDLQKMAAAETELQKRGSLPIPDNPIPDGDETRRLHRWGYVRFREMFNGRQLLGLGTLLQEIRAVDQKNSRDALLTVFSDFLRYQNMLCRYDTYALKCQDIFSVHGFPVGLVQCEDSLLGIPGVGAGAFRHYVEKYVRAKEYCLSPFETRTTGKTKKIVPIVGEQISARIVDEFPSAAERQALLRPASAEKVSLSPGSLDGVFTDPPYYNNVQYAELMDFCYVWLRMVLSSEFSAFVGGSTRASGELTGNNTMEKGIEFFTEGLSTIYRHYAVALKPGAPFVFTYHHNDPLAYVPIVVAILDSDLDCTATLPAPAEMGASLHIARSKSSVLDSIFVCRAGKANAVGEPLEERLRADIEALRKAGLELSDGDIQCLATGHVARFAVNELRRSWDRTQPLPQRVSVARACLSRIASDIGLPSLLEQLRNPQGEHGSHPAYAAASV
jgi:adenine-specific DNA methylase